MADRDEALAHFQAITGMHDLEECRACLEAHGWNLDEAVQSALAHHEAPMMQRSGQTNTSAAFGAPNARGRDIVDAPPPGPAMSGSRGWFHSLTGVPLWNVVSSAVSIASLGTIRPDTGNAAAQLPPQEIQHFIDQLERDYGLDHPTAHVGTFRSAVDKAKAEFKFLVVYLHSPHHEDTPPFCRDTLCCPPFKEFVDDNFVFWMGSILHKEAFTASQLLRAAGFPFVAVLTTADGRTTVCDAHEGPVRREDLTNWLINIMETQGPQLVAQRAEWEERATDRRLRQEQDHAFEQSLLEDQERERAAAAAQREQEEAEAEAAAAALSMEEAARWLAADKDAKRRFFEDRPEPPPGPEAVHIAIRLPSGLRLQRRFLTTDTVQLVYDLVDGCGDLEGAVAGKFNLASSFPKRVLTDPAATLGAEGLTQQATLFLHECD